MAFRQREDSKRLWIYGKNPVSEAIGSNQSVTRIFLFSGMAREEKEGYRAISRQRSIEIKEVSKEELFRMTGTDKHQGVAAQLEGIRTLSLKEAMEHLVKAKRPRLVVALDSVNDPHNIGAVLRTMACAGSTLLMINQSNSAPLNETVAKVSCGGLFYVPVCAANLSMGLERLKEIGFWVFGFEAEGTKDMWETELSGDIALVFGSEGSGMRELTAKKCDMTVKIPMFGSIDSLNLSVSAALAMYEALRQRKFKK